MNIPIQWLSEASQIVNAISVVVLVLVTWYYARTTKRILRESEKMRQAAERQATYAASQANSAQESLNILRGQIENLLGLGSSVVCTAIDSTIRNIEDWKKLDISHNLATAKYFPPSSGILPGNAQTVLEHARKISNECVSLLNDAFSDLRTAQNYIEMLKQGGGPYFNPSKYDPAPFLTTAFSKLQEARKFVY
ncbi:MAG: hypothetical protein LAO19_00155 [Acidobacteriia bacterium]|nr:hypothetical protein [Terriglobia bacterium]